ncbi:hypothetical protein WG909_06135 [Peptostreptococcaceae bacterium AGR-M142]
MKLYKYIFLFFILMSFGTQALTSEDFYKENVELEREIKDFNINTYDKNMYEFVYTYNYDFRIGEKFDLDGIDIELDKYNYFGNKSAKGKNKRNYESNENRGNTKANKNNGTEIKKVFSDEDKNCYILDKKYSDITGDNGLDEISLVGYKKNQCDEYSYEIFIVVKDSKTSKSIKINYKDFDGYESKLYIADFDGDKINDILAYSKKEKELDSTNNHILTFKDFIIRDIFANDIPTDMEINLLNNYIISLKYQDKEVKTVLNNDVKNYYKGKKVYINSKLQNKNQNLKISKISYLVPLDINMDGDFEFSVRYPIMDDKNKKIADIDIIYDYKDDNLSIYSMSFN